MFSTLSSLVCDIGIGLFEFQFDVNFLITRFSLASFGDPWWPRSRRRSSQVDCLAPTNWEPPAQNIRSPVSNIRNFCLWNGALFDNFVYKLYPLMAKFYLFRDFSYFFYTVRYCR